MSVLEGSCTRKVIDAGPLREVWVRGWVKIVKDIVVVPLRHFFVQEFVAIVIHHYQQIMSSNGNLFQ